MMQRTVYPARTGHDLTHVNRLAVPEFGILDLRIAAGAKTSRFHQPAGSPAPKTAENGAKDFHFIPEHETVEIRYEIEDRFVLVDGAKLELFARFDENPLWSLDLKDLGEDWWAHGKHVVKWDGRIVKPTAKQAGTEKDGGLAHDLTSIKADTTIATFADGYVTLEHTPYKLKLTLTSTVAKDMGNPDVAWTYYQILLKSIELELGPEEAVPAGAVNDDEHRRNKAIRTKIDSDGGLPGDGGSRKVFLISNLFKTAGAQMDDNTAFAVYQTLWGNGPQIPVFAKIRLAASDDSEVKIDETDKGAVALGKVKFLWDWEDPDEDVAGQQGQAAPRAFINNAIAYYKNGTDATRAGDDHTYPTGDNCHLDRGGKRGPGAAAIFPAQAGYDPKDTLDAGAFPFKVEASTERKWAALSQGWTKGKMKGKTGVVFRPSRMADDNYILTVYLAYDKKDKDKLTLNVKDEPLVSPVVIKKATGKFQTWREIHIGRYIRKKNTIADFVAANLGAVRGNYNEAYVEVVDKMQAADKYEVPTAGYNGFASARLTGAGDEILNLAADPAADHSSTSSTFLLRDFNAFKTAARASLAAADPTLAAPALDTARDTWLTTKAVDTAVKYSNKLNTLLNAPAKAVVNDLNTLNGAKSGLTIIHFNFLDTVRAGLDGTAGLSTLNGSAVDVPGNALDKCCLILWVSALDTCVHEVGHHMFLPHFGPKPDAFVADRHDSADLQCIMTYNRPRPTFCGLCQLRMRGWDANAVDKTSANNRKP